MLTNEDILRLCPGDILYNRNVSYSYSGLTDGTHFWFYDMDDEDPQEPEIALTRSQVKQMSKI